VPARSTRKVLSNGDSKAITIPADWAKAYGIEIGDTLEVLYGSVIIIKPVDLEIDLEVLLREFSPILTSYKRTSSGPQ